MATNDVNLQVINSMTQSQIQSLKDANGKIPSLANQLIITDEEDVNLSQLRTEVIYDRLDPNKNLNKPDGIMGNVNVVIDLSKYAYIEVVPEIYNRASLNTGGWSGMYKLDLTTKKPSDSWNVAGYSSAYADDAQSSDINKVTWNFSLFYQASSKTFKWLIEFGGTSYNQNSECFISKIYGVLKEPSMIYTGAELHEGEGISIKNGVISAGQTYSAEEQFTGNYWIDGKPIYRKCNIITLPSQTNKWNYIWTLSSRILTVLKIYSNLYHSYYEQYPDKAELYSNGKELFENHASDYFNGKQLYVIIEYIYRD